MAPACDRKSGGDQGAAVAARAGRHKGGEGQGQWAGGWGRGIEELETSDLGGKDKGSEESENFYC